MQDGVKYVWRWAVHFLKPRFGVPGIGHRWIIHSRTYIGPKGSGWITKQSGQQTVWPSAEKKSFNNKLHFSSQVQEFLALCYRETTASAFLHFFSQSPGRGYFTSFTGRKIALKSSLWKKWLGNKRISLTPPTHLCCALYVHPLLGWDLAAVQSFDTEWQTVTTMSRLALGTSESWLCRFRPLYCVLVKDVF